MRLREEAQRDPKPTRHPLAGQGAAYSPQLAACGRCGGHGSTARPALYRAFSWLATRLRVFTRAARPAGRSPARH